MVKIICIADVGVNIQGRKTASFQNSAHSTYYYTAVVAQYFILNKTLKLNVYLFIYFFNTTRQNSVRIFGTRCLCCSNEETDDCGIWKRKAWLKWIICMLCMYLAKSSHCKVHVLKHRSTAANVYSVVTKICSSMSRIVKATVDDWGTGWFFSLGLYGETMPLTASLGSCG